VGTGVGIRWACGLQREHRHGHASLITAMMMRLKRKQFLFVNTLLAQSQTTARSNPLIGAEMADSID
jgi:hypothetical protein